MSKKKIPVTVLFTEEELNQLILVKESIYKKDKYRTVESIIKDFIQTGVDITLNDDYTQDFIF